MKTRLGVTVDRDVADEARKQAGIRGLSVSALLQRSLVSFLWDTRPRPARREKRVGAGRTIGKK
jgi:post-segregation antitoxin (ccd killing protein)